MRLGASLGVVAAVLCAGRSDLGLGLVLPVFGAVLIFIVGDVLRHAVRPVAPVRVVTR